MLDGGPWDSLGIGTWYAAHICKSVLSKSQSLPMTEGKF
jgi:hypothetical protein